MLFVEHALQLSERVRLPFELRLNRSVRPVLDEPPDVQGVRTGPDELPEPDSLHLADEPESNPDSSHTQQTSDLK